MIYNLLTRLPNKIRRGFILPSGEMGTMSLESAAQVAVATEPTDVSQIKRLGPLSFRPTPVWKRCLDVVAAVLLLTLIMPLFVIVAIVIKLGSRGPVFFRQQRVGGRGDMFGIWKFRTMHVDTDTNRHQQHVTSLVKSSQPVRKLHNASQLIPFGRVMRSCCIDELPQFFNVLSGEMSLVGPRPDVLSLEDYEPWQLRRFDVAPGMTGLWQVSGKNETTFEEMMKLDIEYVEQRSLGLDLMILLWTIPAIVNNALYHERENDS